MVYGSYGPLMRVLEFRFALLLLFLPSLFFFSSFCYLSSEMWVHCRKRKSARIGEYFPRLHTFGCKCAHHKTQKNGQLDPKSVEMNWWKWPSADFNAHKIFANYIGTHTLSLGAIECVTIQPESYYWRKKSLYDSLRPITKRGPQISLVECRFLSEMSHLKMCGWATVTYNFVCFNLIRNVR